jgi:molybdate transport system substrate-binding protein
MAEVRVMLSAAFKPAYLELVPRFEGSTGHRIVSAWVSTAQMLGRLRGGEPADLVILHAAGLEAMIREGLIDAASRLDLATCGVAVAVRKGAQKPDLSSGEALKRAVLAARSIVYSTGPSGIYLSRLFERMGIADSIRAKVIQVQGEPTGAVVARGDAELGFQQTSELLPVAGIDIVGPLPPDVQEITTFCGGVHVGAVQPAAAKALLEFFISPEAAPVIRRTGMEPPPFTRRTDFRS